MNTAFNTLQSACVPSTAFLIAERGGASARHTLRDRFLGFASTCWESSKKMELGAEERTFLRYGSVKAWGIFAWRSFPTFFFSAIGRIWTIDVSDTCYCPTSCLSYLARYHQPLLLGGFVGAKLWKAFFHWLPVSGFVVDVRQPEILEAISPPRSKMQGSNKKAKICVLHVSCRHKFRAWERQRPGEDMRYSTIKSQQM